MTILGGAWIFLGFLVAYFFVVAFGLYSRKGSGINQRAYRNAYTAAHGAELPNSLGGRDERMRDWSRGAR
jgi:hypothetical protein